MSEISAQQYQTMLDGLAGCYAANDLNLLARQMMKLVNTLVPGVHLSYNELDINGAAASTVCSDATLERRAGDYLPAFEQHMGDHPVLKDVLQQARRGAPPQVRRISDLQSDNRFLSSGLYADVYRHLQTRYQMILPLRMNSTVVGIAINRDRRDFDESERLIAQTLLPHLSFAYRAVRQREQLRRLWNERDEPAALEALGSLGLTPRQSRVLFWTMQGKSASEMAIILKSRPRTIQKHTENIFNRLGVHSRAEAIGRVVERFLEAGDPQ